MSKIKTSKSWYEDGELFSTCTKCGSKVPEKTLEPGDRRMIFQENDVVILKSDIAPNIFDRAGKLVYDDGGDLMVLHREQKYQ